MTYIYSPIILIDFVVDKGNEKTFIMCKVCHQVLMFGAKSLEEVTTERDSIGNSDGTRTRGNSYF